MPMKPYPLICYQPKCGRPARFKIAATWSDGHTQELKTYGLTCQQCLAIWYPRSLASQKICRLTRGETLESPGIFELSRGRRDRQLTRRLDLERIYFRGEPTEALPPS